MEGEQNPYQPPDFQEGSRSIWTMLAELFSSGEQIAKRRFIEGYAILFQGVAFFVYPKEPTVLYAASPSSVTTESRMNLIVVEVVRLLPEFLAAYPNLQDVVANRKVVVRMIGSYDRIQAEFLREVELELRLLD